MEGKNPTKSRKKPQGTEEGARSAGGEMMLPESPISLKSAKRLGSFPLGKSTNHPRRQRGREPSREKAIDLAGNLL